MITSKTLLSKGVPNQKTNHQNFSMRLFLLSLFNVAFLLVFLPLAAYKQVVILTLLPTSLCLWFGPLALLKKDKKQKAFEPATLFNLSLFYYSIKGISFAWGEQTKFLETLSLDSILSSYPLVVMYTSIGIVVWNWGYRKVLKNKHKSIKIEIKTTYTNDIKLISNRLRPNFGVGFLTIIGVVSFYLLFWSIGEDPFIFIRSSWKRGYISDQSVFGTGAALANFFLVGINMLNVGSLVWLAIIGTQGKKPYLAWFVFTLITIFISLIVYSRAVVLGFIIAIFIIYHLKVSSVRTFNIGLFGIVGILYSYVIAVWRGVTGTLQTTDVKSGLTILFDQLQLGGFFEFIRSEALADIRVFVLVQNVYGNVLPLKNGETILRIVYQFVPRAIWAGKPLDLGVELGRIANPYTFSGTPPGFFAEMYMNFHFVGVILGSAFLGGVLAYCYKYWVVSDRKQVLGVILFSILAQRILLLPSNTLSLAFFNIFMPMAGAILAIKLCELDAKSGVNNNFSLKEKLAENQALFGKQK